MKYGISRWKLCNILKFCLFYLVGRNSSHFQNKITCVTQFVCLNLMIVLQFWKLVAFICSQFISISVTKEVAVQAKNDDSFGNETSFGGFGFYRTKLTFGLFLGGYRRSTGSGGEGKWPSGRQGWNKEPGDGDERLQQGGGDQEPEPGPAGATRSRARNLSRRAKVGIREVIYIIFIFRTFVFIAIFFLIFP
jgi:hypothetical protein